MAASNDDDAADADVPDKSKLAKLNSGAAKNHRVRFLYPLIHPEMIYKWNK